MWIVIIGIIGVFWMRLLDIPEEAFTSDLYLHYIPISFRLIVALVILIIGLIMFVKK